MTRPQHASAAAAANTNMAASLPAGSSSSSSTPAILCAALATAVGAVQGVCAFSPGTGTAPAGITSLTLPKRIPTGAAAADSSTTSMSSKMTNNNYRRRRRSSSSTTITSSSALFSSLFDPREGKPNSAAGGDQQPPHPQQSQHNDTMAHHPTHASSSTSRPFFADTVPAAPPAPGGVGGSSGEDSPYGFHGGSTFAAPLPTDADEYSEAAAGGEANSFANPNGRAISETAPEVNMWTTLMADGTNAAIYGPGKEDMSTEEEAMEVLYNGLRDLTSFDHGEIERYWGQIMPTVAYLGTEGCHMIHQALRVAYRAHREQKRKSGEPFIIHPVEVSLLLSGLKMDAETVAAGLLHDTVEDTDLTFSQVEAMFGPVVRTIVEGETKVSKLPKLVFNDFADEQAENLRQMFVAMTEDYRIIIVKLADRLHNMRTLQHMKPEKQVKISRETLDIFAPLAHRMGIWQFKSELEDTAFMYLYPAEYRRLNRELRKHQTKFRDTLDKSKEILQQTLESDPTLRDQATKIEVMGRTKELYSLWHKMETKETKDLDHIADVVALRVILTPNPPSEEEMEKNVADRGVWLCYHVLGLVQHLPGFQPVPTRVKDYISFPKPNGYQSLHTALNLNGQVVEVQIRTAAMHQVAEYGMASHWAYTDSKKRTDGGDVYNTPWLSSIKEWQDDVVCSRDFVDCVRQELLGKRVFVFLRNGKILNLARGATVIDAAFQIHSEVGLAMHGAEINGKPVPFAYELQNGDVVSILTGKGTPQIDWMRYAKSRSTRSKLRAYFREKQKESLREAGKILLHDFLQMHRELIQEASYLPQPIDIPVDDLQRMNNYLPGRTRYKEVDQLLVAIGKSHNRSFLRGIVSKIFKVPLSRFTEAEESKHASILESVTSAVLRSRSIARDAAAAAKEAKLGSAIDAATNGEGGINGDAYTMPLNGDMNYSPGISLEVADPDHLCEDCLPIFGDDIVGTRPAGDAGIGITATVHRRGCPHAERALLRSSSAAPISSDDKTSNRFTNRQVNYKPHEAEVPVALKWPEADESHQDDDDFYLAEVVLVAADRKLLLADCSEAVSRCSEIVRTGSTTTNEHAILEFLVQVKNVDELQTLMDELREIDSVMSVER